MEFLFGILIGVLIGFVAGFVFALQKIANMVRDGKDVTIVDGEVEVVKRKIETKKMT